MLLGLLWERNSRLVNKRGSVANTKQEKTHIRISQRWVLQKNGVAKEGVILAISDVFDPHLY
jgi:hypothetical protein